MYIIARKASRTTEPRGFCSSSFPAAIRSRATALQPIALQNDDKEILAGPNGAVNALLLRPDQRIIGERRKPDRNFGEAINSSRHGPVTTDSTDKFLI
jgi:hypothetical protein